MKTPPKLSRRKFLSSVGVAAGAAAVVPVVKSINALGQGGKMAADAKGVAKVSARRHPAVASLAVLKPVRVLSRQPGTAFLPLSKRPL